MYIFCFTQSIIIKNFLLFMDSFKVYCIFDSLEDFSCILMLMISSLDSLYSENILCMLVYEDNFWFPIIWYLLENVPCPLETTYILVQC